MIAVEPEKRGYAVLYRAPQICPACAGRQWWIGRRSAECALCGAALALAPEEPVTGEFLAWGR